MEVVFFEIFGKINGGKQEVSPQGGVNKDLFGTLSDEELEQSNPSVNPEEENRDGYLF